MMIIKIQRCPEGKINVAVVSIHSYKTNPNSNYVIRLIEICLLKRRSLSPLNLNCKGEPRKERPGKVGSKEKQVSSAFLITPLFFVVRLFTLSSPANVNITLIGKK